VSVDGKGMKTDVWSGGQQNLISRATATQKAQSLAEIKANLQDLKDEFDIE
jgi:hypothetical protein